MTTSDHEPSSHTIVLPPSTPTDTSLVNSSVERVSAMHVQANNSAIRELEAEHLELNNGAVALSQSVEATLTESVAGVVIAATDVIVSRGVAGAVVAGNNLDLSMGIAAAAVVGHDLTFSQSGAATLLAGHDVTINEGGAGFLVAGGGITTQQSGTGFLITTHAEVRDGIIGFLLSGSTTLHPGTKVLLGVREAAVFGAVCGVVFALLSRWMGARPREIEK